MGKNILNPNVGFGWLAGKAEDGAELTHRETQGGMLETL